MRLLNIAVALMFAAVVSLVLLFITDSPAALVLVMMFTMLGGACVFVDSKLEQQRRVRARLHRVVALAHTNKISEHWKL